MPDSADLSRRPPRARAALLVMLAVALVAMAGFVALGVWQVKRLAWKTALIAQVEARIHAAPVPAPGPEAWPWVDRDGDQYLKVSLRGTFQNDRETLVQAVSDFGPGYWVLTPLREDRGFTVLVNRGFVPPDRKDPASRAAGQPSGRVQVTGLLRMTEPHGGFLRANDPVHDLWRSRDVGAIAARRGLRQAAPYFVDADAAPNPGGWPKGGLTVVTFSNSHLGYAITWFALAGLVGAFAGRLLWEERRRRDRSAGG